MDTSNAEARHTTCSLCSQLADEEVAFQKYGWEQYDTHLPAAANNLKLVTDFRPYDSRQLKLLQCPACKTYYLYRTDYEFLVNGSEDEDFLTRLSDKEAAEYLNR